MFELANQVAGAGANVRRKCIVRVVPRTRDFSVCFFITCRRLPGVFFPSSNQKLSLHDRVPHRKN